MLKSISILLIALFFTSSSFGAHIVGGSMTYQHLGGDNYSIQLEILRDCQGGGATFDQQASIGIYFQDTILFDQLYIDFSNIVEAITFDIPNNVCTLPAFICLEKTIYETTVMLPPISGGYTLAYQRCCRGILLGNIEEPGELGLTIFAKVNSEIPNSSPVFSTELPLAGFVNSPFSQVGTAMDIDGDSLVYELTYPFSGGSIQDVMPDPPSAPPYDSIPYFLPNYSINNILGGANPLSINSQTGEISGIPEILGIFQVAYKIKEYRNGQFLGASYREAPFLVLPPDPSQLYNVSGQVLINNTSIDAAKVEIIERDVLTDSLFVYEEQTILQNENYAFNDIPLGVYYVKAQPDSSSIYFNNYLPTYYNDALFWYDAIALNQCDTSAVSRNINLIHVDSLLGSEVLEGFVSSPNGTNEPVYNLNLFLVNESGDILQYRRTNMDGYFQFSGLDIGTYSIYVDLLNSSIFNDAPPIIEVNGDTSIQYYLYHDRLSSILTSISELPEFDIIKVYPNPVSNILFVERLDNENAKIELMVFNALGGLELKKDLNENVMELDVASLPNGVYYLILSPESGEKYYKKIVITH